MTPLIFALSWISFGTLPKGSYASEATRSTKATIVAFYDPKAKIWKPPVPSAESVGDQGYTFWPSLLAWQAVIEGAKVAPKAWRPQVARFYDALEQYYDPGAHAYCAWKFFPGNDDHFYDDNTWAVVACMEAYETTGEARYRVRAIDIFDRFVKGGWDEKAGGLRWGTKAGVEDRKDHTVSATAAGALAALLVAKTHDTAADRVWAKRALDWIKGLSTPAGLIQDGRKDDGRIMPTLWTYNTGVPIRAAVEYARQTGDRRYRAWAVAMGDAALDRSISPLFDGAVADLSKRYWYDGIYFVQYLVDGLRTLSLATGDPKYLAECRREADYAKAQLRDKDGLYWRSMRLWQIDAERTTAFKRLTGADVALAPDASERSGATADAAKPVGERSMVKTLLANASAARMFWLLSH